MPSLGLGFAGEVVAGPSLATSRMRGLASGAETLTPLSPLRFPFLPPLLAFLKLIFNKGFETSMAKLWDNGRRRVDADWLERGAAWGQMAVPLLSAC